MPSLPVVEYLQVLEDGAVRVRVRRPVRLVCEFDLERREEALRDRVVPAVAAPAHAHDDAVGVEHGAVVAARVLAAAVGVMHEPWVGLAVGEGHRQRLDGELPRDPIAQRTADDPAREEVQDDDQVQPALTRPEVRDVGHPGHVLGRDRELPIEDVGGHREVVVRVRRALEAPLLPRSQALFSHQARHAMAPHVVALCLEFPIDPGTPVAAATGRMGGGDVHGELLILASPRRHRTSLRRVEPGATDPEYRAEQVDRKRGLLSRDEGELHPCSLAKKAVAFFRMSRSIRSVLFSRRKCASSARSSVVSAPPWPRPASVSACATQRRSAVSVRSSSRATAPGLFPLCCTTLTASALNSGENDRRRRFFPMTHSYRTFRAVRSVYETRGSPGDGGGDSGRSSRATTSAKKRRKARSSRCTSIHLTAPVSAASTAAAPSTGYMNPSGSKTRSPRRLTGLRAGLPGAGCSRQYA